MIQFTNGAASIVVLADFAPARFHPDWFVRMSLVPAGFLEDAEVSVVASNHAAWKHPLLGDFAMLPDRMSITCKDDAFWFVMRDVVAGMLSVDAGVVVRAIGINYHGSCCLTDDDADPSVWQAIGDVFTPKEIWKESFLDIGREVNPGTEGFRISYFLDPEKLPGSKRIFGVDAVLNSPFTISLLVNTHFDIALAVADSTENAATISPESGQDLVQTLLERQFESSLLDGRREIEKVLRAALESARNSLSRR